MKTHYQEVKLRDVLAFFAEAFEFKGGEKLHDYEAFLDASKGVVVFKLKTVEGGNNDS